MGYLFSRSTQITVLWKVFSRKTFLTTALARGLYFWPGMSNDIRQMLSACTECARVLPSQPANPLSTAPPSSHFGFPMQHVGLDLFSFGGMDYLICVDHWTGYPLYQLLCSTTSDSVTRCLSSWFNLLGWSYLSEVMVDLNFGAISPLSVIGMAFDMSCLPLQS